MSLSVVIPFRNEDENLRETIYRIHETLSTASITFQILAVNDYSTDDSMQVGCDIADKLSNVIILNNYRSPGFGTALQCGFEKAENQYIAIVMADASEYPEDIVSYYHSIRSNHCDMVLGSRFLTRSTVNNYPFLKLVLNRLGNRYISYKIGVRYNDFTNAFKIYSTQLIRHLMPLESDDFSITIEICCKAIRRNASFQIIPIGWRGRDKGQSKFNIIRNTFRYWKAFHKYGA